MELQNKRCKPCEGGKPLSATEVQHYLLDVPKWNSDGVSITREFTRRNFQDALDFINRIGAVAESGGHHPDLFLHAYKKVRVRLSTHAVGGLSENDFILAAKIDRLS
jgi:4a-hydroxytetrahydrobiopterin dehydratase